MTNKPKTSDKHILWFTIDGEREFGVTIEDVRSVDTAIFGAEIESFPWDEISERAQLGTGAVISRYTLELAASAS